MKRREFVLAGLAAGFTASGCSTPGIKLDAPYVSTPQPVVDAMLRIAEVGRNDVVYDLGCGDGRIVISAASTFGARGVGVDLDPRRIDEATAAARSAGVSYQFGIGDWIPDASEGIWSGELRSEIFLFKLPPR